MWKALWQPFRHLTIPWRDKNSLVKDKVILGCLFILPILYPFDFLTPMSEKSLYDNCEGINMTSHPFPTLQKFDSPGVIWTAAEKVVTGIEKELKTCLSLSNYIQRGWQLLARDRQRVYKQLMSASVLTCIHDYFHSVVRGSSRVENDSTLLFVANRRC